MTRNYYTQKENQRQFHSPVTIMIYLGTGESAMKIRENLQKEAAIRNISVAKWVLTLLKKAAPQTFK